MRHYRATAECLAQIPHTAQRSWEVELPWTPAVVVDLEVNGTGCASHLMMDEQAGYLTHLLQHCHRRLRNIHLRYYYRGASFAFFHM